MQNHRGKSILLSSFVKEEPPKLRKKLLYIKMDNNFLKIIVPQIYKRFQIGGSLLIKREQRRFAFRGQVRFAINSITITNLRRI